MYVQTMMAAMIHTTIITSPPTATMEINVVSTHNRWLKNVSLDKMQYLDFLPKFQDLQQNEFSNILKNFTAIFSLLQELHLLQYFIPYFKITPNKLGVTCNADD